MLRRLLPLLVAIVAIPPAASAQDGTQTNLADIEDEVMCPICGTLLELSEAPQAERQREFIRERIAQGQTKDEIKAALVAEYGEEVLAIPDDEGFDLAAWVVPAVGLGLAATAIGVGLRRWRRTSIGARRPTDGPSAPDSERLSSDIARYDL